MRTYPQSVFSYDGLDCDGRADMDVLYFMLYLARRLSFDTNGSMWTTEYGWQLRMLLAWQRLVRAGKVTQARRGSSVWRDAEAKRLSAMARTAWEGAMPSKRGRVEGFAWRDETTVAREQNVTSGAAAVLVRRQHHQQARTREVAQWAYHNPPSP